MAVHVGQQRDLQAQRQLPVQPPGPLDAPEDQAAGKRQERQPAAQVARAHDSRQPAERAERQQVFHGYGQLAVSEQQGRRPRRQLAFGPEREVRSVFREDAEARPAQPVGVGDVFAVDRR